MPWRICRNEFAERMFALFVRHDMEIFQSFELINEVWRPMGLPLIGAHHAGIEVLGAEYSYGPPGIEIGSPWTSEVAMGALDLACYSGFWFHYHSQKVIGCQGSKMLKCLVCGHVTTTNCSLNGQFHDEMVRIIYDLSKPDMNGDEYEARWWFQIFFILTLTWGNDPFWRVSFSNGLVQPPTSWHERGSRKMRVIHVAPHWRSFLIYRHEPPNCCQ